MLRRPVELGQYLAIRYADRLAAAGAVASVGTVGDCWGNAAAESFFAALKNEMYHQHTFPTRARARFAVAEYIEVFYNRQRLHSTLGYRTSAEGRADFVTATAA